jgi:FixJ family two-component response regulator
LTANVPLIAIVDDDEAIRLSIVSLMRSLGYRADAYASAEALLATAATHRPDCIISDIRMPGMDGVALLGHLRCFAPPPPVILITAYADQALRARAAAAGALRVLLKPMDEDCLIACIEAAVAAGQERPPA